MIGSVVLLLAEIAMIVRALLRPHREPASRLAWIMAILALPVLGILLYLLLGETRISAPRRSRGREINARLPRPEGAYLCSDERGAERTGRRSRSLGPSTTSIRRLETRARLAPDSNAAISEMVVDIDRALETVHACFYIWLADKMG